MAGTLARMAGPSGILGSAPGKPKGPTLDDGRDPSTDPALASLASLVLGDAGVAPRHARATAAVERAVSVAEEAWAWARANAHKGPGTALVGAGRMLVDVLFRLAGKLAPTLWGDAPAVVTQTIRRTRFTAFLGVRKFHDPAPDPGQQPATTASGPALSGGSTLARRPLPTADRTPSTHRSTAPAPAPTSPPTTSARQRKKGLRFVDPVVVPPKAPAPPRKRGSKVVAPPASSEGAGAGEAPARSQAPEVVEGPVVVEARPVGPTTPAKDAAWDLIERLERGEDVPVGEIHGVVEEIVEETRIAPIPPQRSLDEQLDDLRDEE